MPMVSFDSAGSNPSGSNSTALSIPVPPTVNINDIAICQMYVESTQAVTPPANFVAAPNSPVVVTGSNNHDLHVFWKRLTAVDVGTYDFTIAAGLVWRQGFAVAYSGCITVGNPFEATNSAIKTTTTDGTIPAVLLNTLGPNRMLVWCASEFSLASVTPTPPAGYTQRAAWTASENGLVLADAVQQAVGNSGSVSGASFASSGGTAAWLGALIPAPLMIPKPSIQSVPVQRSILY